MVSIIKIGAIGYNYVHDETFVMDRPNGVGCHLLLLIKNPSVFEINGSQINVKANSFIIFTPEATCKYRAAGKIYTDDWMYFDADENDINELSELGIPINKIVHLSNIDELTQIMHILAYEHFSAEVNNLEIEQHYIKILLLKISRIIKSKSYISSDAFIERNYRFTQLRTEIYTMPDSIGSIEHMAASVGMSRSGFQHLYKKMFGVSVMTDVINGRLERGKRLLCSTNLTIKEISEKCGYANEFNFMRQFKARTGKTPTEYRKCI